MTPLRLALVFLGFAALGLADPRITTNNLPSGVVGVQYSAQLQATSGTPGYTWSLASGDLPPGLSLATSGLISGSPSQAGEFRFTVRVRDSVQDSDTRALTIIIQPALNITTASLPSGQVGAAYSASLAASGGTPPYAWSLASGSLPAGLTISTAGVISGTPTASGTANFAVRVTDSASLTNTKMLSIQVTPAPLVIPPTTLPAGQVGAPYSAALTANGGTPPYTWTVTAGALPGGVTLSTAGQISGTPASAGTFNFTAQVTDSAMQTASAPLSIQVAAPALAIQTASLPSGQVGAAYSATLTGSGGTPPYTWTISTGSLPAGLTLSPGGQISGTPTAAGTANFTVRITDSAQQTTTKALSIQIAAPALSVDTATLPGGQVGAAYSATLAAAGGTPPFTWAIDTGALPAGVTLASNGQISGTPTATGTANFTVRVTDSAQQTATKALSIQIGAAALSITTASLPSGQVGSPYNAALAASGGTTPYTWALDSGTLPAGLSLTPAGQISGTPASAGTANFTVRVSDAAQQSTTRALSIQINPAGLAVDTATLPAAQVGTAYNGSLAGSGGTPPYTWALDSGSLPAGLTLAPSGAIAGTPTAAGTANFTVRLTDSANQSVTKALSIQVTAAPLTIDTTALPSGQAGVAYSATLAASGGTGPYTWAVAAGTLPAGLTLSNSGQLTGTVSAPGTFNFSVRVTDSASQTVTRALTLQVAASSLSVTTTSLAAGQVGAAYSQTLAAAGGTAPYTWAISTGSLPSGLTLNPNGQISGTPTVSGSSSFTVRVTDSASQSATRPLSISIVGPDLSIGPETLPSGQIGAPYAAALSASGGTAPYTFALASGTLPSGVNLTSSGQLSGTPSASGTFSFTIRVTDAAQRVATRNYSVQVTGSDLAVSTASLPPARIGVPYSASLAASGGVQPYSWTLASGTLPGGVTLSAAGQLTGTPTASGSFSFVARVSDAASQSATRPLTLQVNAATLSIDTQSVPGGQIGAPYSATISASGGIQPYNFSISAGSLPAGLTLNATGQLTGAPTAAGQFNFTVRVADSAQNSATRAYSMTIAPGVLVVTTSTLASGATNSPYSQTLAASGGAPPYRWSVAAGALPAGLTLDATGGSIAGVPTTAGQFSFTVRVADSANQTADKPLAIAVTASVSLTQCPAPSARAGISYASLLSAAGGRPPYVWSVTGGQLPPGISLDGSTGEVSGIASRTGNFSATFRVTDAAAQSDSRVCAIVVTAPLTIQTTTISDGALRTSFVQSLVAAGGTAPYTWSIASGSLPAGLSLASNGILSGMPTQAGNFNFTVRVTDAANASVDRVFTVAIAAGLSIANCPAPRATSGSAYSSTITGAGGQPPYTWSSSGSLPPGLSLAEGSGVLSGTPTTTGPYSFTLRVADVANASMTRVCSIEVATPLLLTRESLPGGSVGAPYSETLSASGGRTPYLWSVSAGALPPGVFLDAGAGRLSGSPTQPGTFNVAFTVTDAAGVARERTYTIIISSGMTVSACPSPNATSGQPYISSAAVAGGEAPYQWTIAGGGLPGGISIDASTGAITGTPGATGAAEFTLGVTDRTSVQAQRTCSITVSSPSLAISSSELMPDAILGAGYTQRFAASGGTEPYVWTLIDGSLPRGLTLQPDGTITGTPETGGVFTFSVRVEDRGRNTVTRAFRLRSLPGAFPGFTFSSIPEIVRGAEQPPIQFGLASGYPVALRGRVTLTFEPDPGLPDDPSIQFVTGGRTATFTIPVNSVSPTFSVPQLALQTGTVAGTIRLTLQVDADGLDLTPSPAPVRTIRVDRTAPVITSARIVQTSSGFELRIIGYSTTREVSRGTFRFVPAPGSALQTSEISLDLGAPARLWFDNAASNQFGGQFLLTQPFSVQGASLRSVSITLTNGQGTSQATELNF